jgi:hypothetical protein
MQSMKAACSDRWKRSNCRSAPKWSLSRARWRDRKITTAIWMAFTPYWANVTNPATTMWLPAIMNVSREADSAGLVDHVSFTIMRRLGISKAFTNDGHFRAAGFETLF